MWAEEEIDTELVVLRAFALPVLLATVVCAVPVARLAEELVVLLASTPAIPVNVKGFSNVPNCARTV